MGSPVTVVVIQSLSYTGTTWLNLVLGSHEDAFALGPCDRPLSLDRSKAAEACRVHGAECPFWPEFYRTLGDENFFVHLSRVSGKRFIVTNNPLPSGAGRALNHPDIIVKPIDLVRDGRGVAWSYAHKHPNESFFDGVKNWLTPAMEGVECDPGNSDRLFLRYEDILADQKAMLKQAGEFIGIRYDDSAVRFWEHDHHPAAGNAGPVFMIKLHQGVPLPSFARDREFYQQQYDKARANPEHQFESERWRSQLSSRELFVFEYFCGRVNAKLGYEPSRFTLDEVRRFSVELKLDMDLPPDHGSLRERVKPTLVEGLSRGEASTPQSILTGGAGWSVNQDDKPIVARSRVAALAVVFFALTIGVVSIMAATGVFG